MKFTAETPQMGLTGFSGSLAKFSFSAAKFRLIIFYWYRQFLRKISG